MGGNINIYNNSAWLEAKRNLLRINPGRGCTPSPKKVLPEEGGSPAFYTDRC